MYHKILFIVELLSTMHLNCVVWPARMEMMTVLLD